MSDYRALITNEETPNFQEQERFSAILGEQPSKGAKSPVLWNAAFEGLGLSNKMIPLDVPSKNLSDVVETLKKDSKFIGGAVTMPHKEAIVERLDEVEEEAKVIGAVNCIYKKGGRLIGANTDGAGALDSFIQEMGEKKFAEGKRVLLVGLGGAGKAVSVYMAQAIGKQGKLIIANRTKDEAEKFSEKLKRYTTVEIVDWNNRHSSLADVDVIINCTSVGFSGLRTDESGSFYLDGYTPFGSVPEDVRIKTTESKLDYAQKSKAHLIKNYEGSLAALTSANENSVVFDIIYQPQQTLLLKVADVLGIKGISGVGMNLEQAVIAFEKTVSNNYDVDLRREDVRKLMSHYW